MKDNYVTMEFSSVEYAESGCLAVEVLDSYNNDQSIKKWWSCDYCDGDSETGCMLSDPQDCVRN